MTSAAFTINGTAVPSAVATTYGATVSLAVSSLVGVKTITWSIWAASEPGTAIPTITAAGVPSGATATFAMPADPGTGYGCAFGVLCTVLGSDGVTYFAKGIVGVPANLVGMVPFVPSEMTARHATHGWVQDLNHALSALEAPNPTFEAGADTTAVILEFDLPARGIKTTDAGTHDYLFDVGVTRIPVSCDADLLIDFTVNGFRESAGVKTGIGAWKVSGSWSYTSGSPVWTNIGQSALVQIDTSLHSYSPTLTAGTYNTNSHTAKLSMGAADTDTYHWIVSPHCTLVYYPV